MRDDVSCGFCGQLTYPGVRWPALPGMELPDDHVMRGGLAYLWICDDCSDHLAQEDDRVLSVTVRIEDE